MMTLLRNNKILLVVLAAALASAGFWFGVLAPKRQEVTQLDAKITAKESELQQAQQQMATYEKARAAYKSNYAKLVSLGKAVPADDDVRSLMVQLDSISGLAHVDFQKVNVGGGSSSSSAAGSTPSTTSGVGPDGQLAVAPGTIPIGSSGVSALPFSLTFNGSFLKLSTLFTEIERLVTVRNDQVKANGRLLRVESFEINPAGSGWPDMTATVGAASYLVTPVAAPSGDPKAATSSSGTTPASTGGTTPSTTTATVSGVAR